jgi:hypothetical protein
VVRGETGSQRQYAKEQEYQGESFFVCLVHLFYPLITGVKLLFMEHDTLIADYGFS